MFRRTITPGLTLLSMLFLGGAATAQQPTQLRLASFGPPTSFFLVEVVLPWAERVSRDSPGTIEIRHFGGGVIANAGTTNTGAIDPLPELKTFCRGEGLWLHADGAYGAAAIFCERGRALLQGINEVDSLSLDPHKWLFQPYEIGCLLVREAHRLKEAFHVLPEYLKDAEGAAEEINFCDYGIQLTRSFRALKLWMSLQVFGRVGFEAAVRRGFELADLTEKIVGGMAGWEVVTPAQMGVVTFRCVPEDIPPEAVDTLNRTLVNAVVRDDFSMIVSTELHDRPVLRMCTINPRTTEKDIRSTLERLDQMRQHLTSSQAHLSVR